MTLIRKISSSIINNIWNLFGPIGVLASLYLSVIYVPDYVKEITYGKAKEMHESILNDVQEFVFYNKKIDQEDIESFIKGKELKYGISYNYSTREVLLQAQNNFVINKYIPLEKRNDIVKTISSIKIKEEKKARISTWQEIINYLPQTLSIIGIALSILGMISIIFKYRKDKETKIDIESIETHGEESELSGATTYTSYQYEQSVNIALKEIGSKFVSSQIIECENRNYPADFIISGENGKIVVEVKNYRKLLGVGTATQLVEMLANCNHKGILVISSGLTKRASEMVSKHNKINPTARLVIVTGETSQSLKEGLNNAIKSLLTSRST